MSNYASSNNPWWVLKGPSMPLSPSDMSSLGPYKAILTQPTPSAPAPPVIKLKIGDLVEITANVNHHNYTIGDIVQITELSTGIALSYPSSIASYRGTSLTTDRAYETWFTPRECKHLPEGEDNEMVKKHRTKQAQAKAEREAKAKAEREKKIKFFEEIILPTDHVRAIKEAIMQVQPDKHEKLFKKWGFGTLLEKGKGATLLFYGVPGTGKTLMAEAIAGLLDKGLLVVSSAELQSSECGQTERNIKEFFKEAAQKDKVLLFDECDSVIYDRSQVGMILAAEINCLLAEVERFEGVAIFTTNNTPVLDPAFERRLALKLEFPMPDKKSRVKIWQRFFPKPEIVASCVNFEALSKYVLSGGQIKNIVLNAARKACFEGKEKIEQTDLITALEREEAGFKSFQQRTRPRYHQTILDVQPNGRVEKEVECDTEVAE